MANHPKSYLLSLLIIFLIFPSIWARPIHTHHEKTPPSPMQRAKDHRYDEFMALKAIVKNSSGPSPGEGHSNISNIKGSHD